MSTIAIVLRNESIKISRRLAFWVTVIGYSVITFISCSAISSMARRVDPKSLVFPAMWARGLGQIAQPGLLFTGAVLVLLIASEFAWRTARQNVIDGLSKEQWFAGKLIDVPIVALVLALAPIMIIGAFGVAHTNFAAPEYQLIKRPDLLFVGGWLVGLVGVGVMALLISVSVRSAGPALAVMFLYIMLEELLGQGLTIKGGVWAKVAPYLPYRVFNSLAAAQQWHPEARRALRTFLSNEQVLIAASLYIIALGVIAFFVVRKRDL